MVKSNSISNHDFIEQKLGETRQHFLLKLYEMLDNKDI